MPKIQKKFHFHQNFAINAAHKAIDYQKEAFALNFGIEASKTVFLYGGQGCRIISA